MPARSPRTELSSEVLLKRLGSQIRDQRKNLGLSATVTAEAAGMSRVTFYRIEKGEPSVTLGAYLNAIIALGLKLELIQNQKLLTKKTGIKKILISKYPQLKRLAWQIKPAKEINAKEALALYERGWKHIDPNNLTPEERQLIQDLLDYFGRERLLV